MPLHAVCSTVRPSSYLYGMGAHYGGENPISFPQCVFYLSIPHIFLRYSFRWLGQNSKQNKLSRQLTDVQIRMRLKVSGDKTEIRQSYLPALFPYIVKPLMDEGSVRARFGVPSIPLFMYHRRVLLTKSSNEWTSITCRKKTGTQSLSLALTITKTT